MARARQDALTLYRCQRCGLLKMDPAPMIVHSSDCGGEFEPSEYISQERTMPDRLPVTRDQAVRLFSESRVIDVEMVDELAAWTFAGGIVLVLNHTTEPPEFTLGLDGELPARATAGQEVSAHA